MAGNVKEWCWNKVAVDKRCILGGSWEEPNYLFWHSDAQGAMHRLPTCGFRCVRYLSEPLPQAAFADVPAEQQDFHKETPVSDEQFRFIRTAFAYDKGPLNSEVTSRKEFAGHIHETVQFDAAYGSEKVPGHLYLPRNARSPYQTVIFFPAVWPYFPHGEEPPEAIAFLVKSGRAVFWPIYKGTFERIPGWSRPGWSNRRDLCIQMFKDYFSSIDYLEQRTDLDVQKLGYFSISGGGCWGALLLALDDRAKVAVFADGGFGYHSDETPFLELATINFAPRVKMPVLMINGRHDPIFPLETSQRPLFELLGTSKKDKSHRVFDGGHGVPMKIVAQEALPWLDKYLGAVRQEAK